METMKQRMDDILFCNINHQIVYQHTLVVISFPVTFINTWNGTEVGGTDAVPTDTGTSIPIGREVVTTVD